MKNINRALAITVGALCWIGTIQAQSFPMDSYLKHNTNKDTVVVRASTVILHQFIVEAAGSADTVFVWNASATSGMTAANLILRLPAWAIGSYNFGPNGLWLRTGMVLSFNATTVGRYTFLFE